MPLHFAESIRSRIGLEWEVALVDRRSGELSPAAPEILAALGPAEGFPHVTGELLTNTVELVSAPHRSVGNAVGELRRLSEQVIDLAEPLGVEVMSSGTHPFSQWFDQRVTPGKPRYDTLIDRTQWWGRQMMIWGVHIHVGIDARDKVIPILHGLLNYLPCFEVLSASSPFWAGENTGYASNRALLFQQLPTAASPAQTVTSGWPQMCSSTSSTRSRRSPRNSAIWPNCNVCTPSSTAARVTCVSYRSHRQTRGVCGR